MHIAIIADPIDNQKAGIHYFTKEFVTNLAQARTKNRYTVIRLTSRDAIPGIRQLTVKNYMWIPGYKALRMFVILPLAMRRLNVDAVVEPAHFGPFNLPGNIKRVNVIHDLTPLKFPQFHRFHSQLLQRIFLKGILKRASIIIANSENTLKDIIEYLPAAKNKTFRIYLGKDAIFNNKENPGIIRNFGIKQPFFLFVGTIEPRKNLSSLLEAFNFFKEETRLTHQLVIVGQKGWKSGSIFRQIEEHPYRKDINIVGYVKRKELPYIYSHADAFILPSLYEGFGMPLLEAMSCGAPCIIADNSSLPEIGGEAALKFESGSKLQLAGIMKEIATNTDLREEMRTASLQQSEKFSWEKYVSEFDMIMTKHL